MHAICIDVLIIQLLFSTAASTVCVGGIIFTYLLCGKSSLRQIPVLWLVLSRSWFCSTDCFHGNGAIRVFFGLFPWKRCNPCIFVLERSQQIQNLQPKQRKKLWILSFFALKLPEEAEKIEIFPKFQRWMKKTNIFKYKPPAVHFTIRNRVPYNKLLTNLAFSSRTGEYWLTVVCARSCHDLGPIFPWTTLALG